MLFFLIFYFLVAFQRLFFVFAPLESYFPHASPTTPGREGVRMRVRNNFTLKAPEHCRKEYAEVIETIGGNRCSRFFWNVLEVSGELSGRAFAAEYERLLYPSYTFLELGKQPWFVSGVRAGVLHLIHSRRAEDVLVGMYAYLGLHASETSQERPFTIATPSMTRYLRDVLEVKYSAIRESGFEESARSVREALARIEESQN